MYQNQLIAAIFLLFLVHTIAGLPFLGHPFHGSHHRFHHLYHARPRSTPGRGPPLTPASPKIPGTDPVPAKPGNPVTESPPSTPQNPIPVPLPEKPGNLVTESPPATPQNPVPVPIPTKPGIPVTVALPEKPENPVTESPPAAPQNPVPVPIPAKPGIPVTVPTEPSPPPPSLPDGITGEVSEHGKLFGWDPSKALSGCGIKCDLLKYLQKQEFMVAHNWVRLLYKLPFFTWDEKLEGAAKQVVMQHYDDCKMVHSDFPYGENLFWGLKWHWTPSDVVYSWYNESEWYNLKDLTCTAPPGASCGHFTQLVWKDSVRLGCALQHCLDPSKGMIVACEYDPTGNYDDENPLDNNNAQHQT